MTVVIAAFAVVRSAVHLETTVEQHGKSIDEIKRDVSELRAKQK